MRIHDVALIVTAGWWDVVVILTAVALHVAVAFYPIMYMRRSDGITLRVLVRITPIIPVVLRLSKRLRWPIILRFWRRNRLVSACRFILRNWYRFVVGGTAVFGIIGSCLSVMRGNGLSCRSSESVWIVRSRWYVAGFEIIRYIRA